MRHEVTASRTTAIVTARQRLFIPPVYRGSDRAVKVVLDVVRILGNDHVSGALLWDVQFSPNNRARDGSGSKVCE